MPHIPLSPPTFEIKIEFRMPNEGFANSGVQIRSWEEKEKWRVSGYQPDMDWKNEYTGICYGENFRGILANRGQKTVIGKDHKPKVIEQFAKSADLAKFIKMHDWNEYDITARGNHITEKINGHLMCEVTDEDTLARKDGIIALQIHAGEPMKVQFRNVRLKEFKAGEANNQSKQNDKRVQAALQVAGRASKVGRPLEPYFEFERQEEDRLHRRRQESRIRRTRAQSRLPAAGEADQRERARSGSGCLPGLADRSEGIGKRGPASSSTATAARGIS